ncbi:MAG: hypothetical protein QF797_12420 [Alphaproteobacteria bacterium]|nr:hypothetical protein [Alphaproteobacteria bacterium]
MDEVRKRSGSFLIATILFIVVVVGLGMRGPTLAQSNSSETYTVPKEIYVLPGKGIFVGDSNTFLAGVLPAIDPRYSDEIPDWCRICPECCEDDTGGVGESGDNNLILIPNVGVGVSGMGIFLPKATYNSDIAKTLNNQIKNRMKIPFNPKSVRRFSFCAVYPKSCSGRQ